MDSQGFTLRVVSVLGMGQICQCTGFRTLCGFVGTWYWPLPQKKTSVYCWSVGVLEWFCDFDHTLIYQNNPSILIAMYPFESIWVVWELDMTCVWAYQAAATLHDLELYKNRSQHWLICRFLTSNSASIIHELKDRCEHVQQRFRWMTFSRTITVWPWESPSFFQKGHFPSPRF